MFHSEFQSQAEVIWGMAPMKFIIFSTMFCSSTSVFVCLVVKAYCRLTADRKPSFIIGKSNEK